MTNGDSLTQKKEQLIAPLLLQYLSYLRKPSDLMIAR